MDQSFNNTLTFKQIDPSSDKMTVSVLEVGMAYLTAMLHSITEGLFSYLALYSCPIDSKNNIETLTQIVWRKQVLSLT